MGGQISGGGPNAPAPPAPPEIRWDYDLWPSGEPYEWPGEGEGRGMLADDQIDFHVDLGCGRAKKGRIGVDRYPSAGVNVCTDLDALTTISIAEMVGGDAPDPSKMQFGSMADDSDGKLELANVWRTLCYGLPFPDSSIESIISHHAFEHIGPGFIPLMDECYRVLKPGGLLRVVVPLFPSKSAVEDPDHKRYFMTETFKSFCGTPGETPQDCWLASFSVPYTNARFQEGAVDWTVIEPDVDPWSVPRELRVSLRAAK